MSDYADYARTSYFKVNNEEAFMDWLLEFNIADLLERQTIEHGKLFAVVFGQSSHTDWETTYEDFLDEIASHLAEGWGVEFRAIGHEGVRYLDGYACVVRWDGKSTTESLDNARRRACITWGALPWLTDCSY